MITVYLVAGVVSALFILLLIGGFWLLDYSFNIRSAILASISVMLIHLFIFCAVFSFMFIDETTYTNNKYNVAQIAEDKQLTPIEVNTQSPYLVRYSYFNVESWEYYVPNDQNQELNKYVRE